MNKKNVTVYLQWSKHTDELVIYKKLESDTKDESLVNVIVNMKNKIFPHSRKNLIKEILNITDGRLDNLVIENYRSSSRMRRRCINISGLELRSFSLRYGGRESSASAPLIQLDAPSETLRYFHLERADVDQELLNVVSQCPNLAGLIMTRGNPNTDEVISLPAPINSCIKYWIIVLGHLSKVEDWEAESLELAVLARAGLNYIPNVFINPPKTLRTLCLDFNDLDNEAVSNLRSMLFYGGFKHISLIHNRSIIDIPTWEGVDTRECIYYADRVKFNKMSHGLPNPRENVMMGYEKFNKLRMSKSEKAFVLSSTDLSENTRSGLYNKQRHTIDLRLIEFPVSNYPNLIGVSDTFYDTKNPDFYVNRWVP